MSPDPNLSFAKLLSRALAILFASTGLAMFIDQGRRGLWFKGLADETTHLLGGRVLDAGGLLYRDFVDVHGPVIYLFTALYGELAGWSAPNYSRLIPLLLVAFAGGTIATSPALTTLIARLCATGLFFGLTASVWLAQGLHLVSFYPVAGAFAVMVLAWFSVPAWSGRPIPVALGAGAGIAAAFLVFTGYQYLPSVVLFAASGLWAAWRRAQLRPAGMFVISSTICSAAMLLWLAIYGDILGYLAFHIAFGQTAFLPFIQIGLRLFLGSLNPSFASEYLVQALASLGFVVSAALLVIPVSRWEWGGTLSRAPACLLGLIGVLMLNARGAIDFKDGSFVLGVIGLLAIALPAAIDDLARMRPALAALSPFVGTIFLVIVELAARNARTQPVTVSRDMPPVFIAQRVDSPLTDRIRAIVGPQETFLALVYQPDLYWAADRLPMQGFFTYLPWDAAYARRPWFNRPRDLCVALSKTPPKLIVFDNWTVWDLYAPKDYMPCVIEALSSRYCSDPDFPTLYVRLDVHHNGHCD